MTFRTKCLLSLFALALADVVMPIPILGTLLIYVVIEKPPWFEQWTRRLYGKQRPILGGQRPPELRRTFPAAVLRVASMAAEEKYLEFLGGMV